MQSLDEKTWKPAVVDDIFTTIKATKGKTTGQLIEGDDVPYIAAAKTNNGCAGVYSSKPYPEWVSEGNAIVFVQLGDGAAGLAHYIPMPFIGMSGKTSCGYFQHLNKYNGIFIARCLSANKAIFSHGHSWTGQRLIKTKFMLPVTYSGEPDYEYMAEYTRQKCETMLSKYRAYVEERIAELGDSVEIPALDEKEWAHFKMPEIFNMIQRGKRLKNADHVPGKIPYVSSTANNNGVDDYIEATPGTRVFGDCISLANSGSVGTAFYEPFEFVASDHVTALKTAGMSKYEYLFMTSMIEKQGSNFNFNREINDARIRNMQIMLPVTDSGKPDYEYMEQYAKNMTLRKYKQYLTFLDYKKVSED